MVSMQMHRLGRFLGQAAKVGIIGLLLSAGSATAAELHVLASSALKPLFEKLGPEFEAATGNRLVLAWGASSGNAPDALPVRLRNGEKADAVVMIREALDAQIEQGHLRPETTRDLADSRVGLAVRAGAPRPDITTVDDLRSTLLAAKSVAFSSGVSGVYVATTLLPNLGISEQLKPKSVVIDAPELVGHALLRGEAEVGLQQMSELLAVPGIEIVGPLPEAVQRINIIAAAVTTRAEHPEAAEALIAFLSSPNAAQALIASGFGPMGL